MNAADERDPAEEQANEALLTEEQEAEQRSLPATKEEAVKKAYAEATSALRSAHRDEFNKDMAARVKAYGFEWKPKPTATEKRKEQIAALLAEDRDLMDEMINNARGGKPLV
jgi:hypothetical protein